MMLASISVGCGGSTPRGTTDIAPAAARSEEPSASARTSGAPCASVRVVHPGARPVGLPYLKPLSAEYALDAPDDTVLRWDNPDRDQVYVGSCMAGLAGVKPAVWRQPAPVEEPLDAGGHVLFAEHEMVYPVGGYPGAYRIRLQRRIPFEARCGEISEVAVSVHRPGGLLASLEKTELRVKLSRRPMR